VKDEIADINGFYTLQPLFALYSLKSNSRKRRKEIRSDEPVHG